MSTLVLRRVLLPNTSHSFTAARTQIRCIHPTVVALKKKRQAAPPPQTFEQDPDNDSSFDLFPEEDELFGFKPQSAAVSTRGASRHGVKSAELLHKRAESFESLYSSTLEILKRKGKMRQPPRRSTVVRLAALAESKEDLEKVLEVAGAWRSVGLPPDSKTSDEFIGRCTRLKHPEVALKTLQDRPRYGMDVTSLASARRLLHALSLPRTGEDDTSQTLVDCLAFAELYPLYNLPPASSDVVSCAILTSVIARQVPKDQEVKQGVNSGAGVVTLDTWGEILTVFEKAVKGWGDAVGHTNPRAVQWLRGSIREIRLTMQRNEGRTRSWLNRFRKEIRLSSAERNQLSANASV